MNQYFNFALARKELNLTQEEIAEEVGVTRVTIGNTERGKNLSYQYLSHLENKGYSKEWLLGESDVKYVAKNEKLFIINEKESINVEELVQQNIELKKENIEFKKENKSLRQELSDFKDKFIAFQMEVFQMRKEMQMGKRKASSKKTTLSKNEENKLMYLLNFER